MKITILTGAGISAESGIKTFRDADGLWEGHDVMQVASPQGWNNDRELVLDFYNQRRKQLRSVEPNEGHQSLVELEDANDVTIITQNVDDLHERAGSSHVIHLHGELYKVRSTVSSHLVYEWKKDLFLGDTCADGYQLRPDIVWFGEDVPKLQESIPHVMTADILIIIGTSLQVYPAAGLSSYSSSKCKIFYIDPKPELNYELMRANDLTVMEGNATSHVPLLVQKIKKEEL